MPTFYAPKAPARMKPKRPMTKKPLYGGPATAPVKRTTKRRPTLKKTTSPFRRRRSS